MVLYLRKYISFSTFTVCLLCLPLTKAQEKFKQSESVFKTSFSLQYKEVLEDARSKNMLSNLLIDHLEQRYREKRGQILTFESNPEEQAKEFLNASKKVVNDYLRETEGYITLREYAEDRLEWGIEKAEQALDKLIPDKLEIRLRRLLHLDAKKLLGIDLDTREEKLGEELFDPWNNRERLYRTKLGIGLHPSMTFRSGDLKLKIYHDQVRLELEHNLPYNMGVKMGAKIDYNNWERSEPYMRISKMFRWGEIGLGAAKPEKKGVEVGLYLAAKF